MKIYIDMEERRILKREEALKIYVEKLNEMDAEFYSDDMFIDDSFSIPDIEDHHVGKLDLSTESKANLTSILKEARQKAEACEHKHNNDFTKEFRAEIDFKAKTVVYNLFPYQEEGLEELNQLKADTVATYAIPIACIVELYVDSIVPDLVDSAIQNNTSLEASSIIDSVSQNISRVVRGQLSDVIEVSVI